MNWPWICRVTAISSWFHIFCSPLVLRPERHHQHRAANVRERPTDAFRKGPLFDIRGSVLAVGKRAPATIYGNRETATTTAYIRSKYVSSYLCDWVRVEAINYRNRSSTR
jgi:hypothetical protein